MTGCKNCDRRAKEKVIMEFNPPYWVLYVIAFIFGAGIFGKYILPDKALLFDYVLYIGIALLVIWVCALTQILTDYIKHNEGAK